MKKRYHLLASLLMLATLPLSAQNAPAESEEIALESQETAQYGNRRVGPLGSKQEGRKCRECDKPEVYVVPEEIAIESQKNMITPTVYPYVSQGPNIYASVDFIWWQPVLNGTIYAYNGVTDFDNPPPGISVIGGKLGRPNFGFEPGFKIALGGHFDHDGWNVEAEYTYLPANADNSLNTTRDKGAATLFSIVDGDGVIGPISISEAKEKWNQNFNLLTVALGRNFFISKYLTLKPYIGMNAAWIGEKLKQRFTPSNTVLTSAANTLKKQSTWGLGLRGGIDTMWHVTREFAFYGDLGLSSFWGHFHTKTRQTVTEDLFGTYATLDVDTSFSSVIPVLETGLGLAYINWFNKDKVRAQVQLGWEHQLWTDFNYLGSLEGNGSLSMQGLTFKVGFTF